MKIERKSCSSKFTEKVYFVSYCKLGHCFEKLLGFQIVDIFFQWLLSHDNYHMRYHKRNKLSKFDHLWIHFSSHGPQLIRSVVNMFFFSLQDLVHLNVIIRNRMSILEQWHDYHSQWAWASCCTSDGAAVNKQHCLVHRAFHSDEVCWEVWVLWASPGLKASDHNPFSVWHNAWSFASKDILLAVSGR